MKSDVKNAKRKTVSVTSVLGHHLTQTGFLPQLKKTDGLIFTGKELNKLAWLWVRVYLQVELGSRGWEKREFEQMIRE